MPREAALLAVLLLSMLAGGCAAARDQPCVARAGIVHVVDEPGLADRVLLEVHGAADFPSGLLAFTLPDDWPSRPTILGDDGVHRLATPLDPELQPLTAIEMRPGQRFSSSLLPAHEREGVMALLEHNAAGLEKRLQAALAGERYGRPLEAALAGRHHVYGAGDAVADPPDGRRVQLFGLVHEPPRWVLLAEFDVRLRPRDDPYWDDLGCEPPGPVAETVKGAFTLAMWAAFYVVLFG